MKRNLLILLAVLAIACAVPIASAETVPPSVGLICSALLGLGLMDWRGKEN